MRTSLLVLLAGVASAAGDAAIKPTNTEVREYLRKMAAVTHRADLQAKDYIEKLPKPQVGPTAQEKAARMYAKRVAKESTKEAKLEDHLKKVKASEEHNALVITRALEASRERAGSQYVASLDNQVDRYTDATTIRMNEDTMQHAAAVSRAAQQQARAGSMDLQSVLQEAKEQGTAAQQYSLQLENSIAPELEKLKYEGAHTPFGGQLVTGVANSAALTMVQEGETLSGSTCNVGDNVRCFAPDATGADKDTMCAGDQCCPGSPSITCPSASSSYTACGTAKVIDCTSPPAAQGGSGNEVIVRTFQGGTVQCPTGKTCELQCKGPRACRDLQGGSGVFSKISCDGELACQSAQPPSTDALTCELECRGQYACYLLKGGTEHYSKINCDKGASVTSDIACSEVTTPSPPP